MNRSKIKFRKKIIRGTVSKKLNIYGKVVFVKLTANFIISINTFAIKYKTKKDTVSDCWPDRTVHWLV